MLQRADIAASFGVRGSQGSLARESPTVKQVIYSHVAMRTVLEGERRGLRSKFLHACLFYDTSYGITIPCEQTCEIITVFIAP